MIDIILGLIAAYVAGYLVLSASLGPGPQPALHLPGLVATGAVLALTLAALVSGVLWATTFGSFFARWVAVPLAVGLSTLVWATLMMKVFHDVADGSGRTRTIGAILGVLAVGSIAGASVACLDRWRLVAA